MLQSCVVVNLVVATVDVAVVVVVVTVVVVVVDGEADQKLRNWSFFRFGQSNPFFENGHGFENVNNCQRPIEQVHSFFRRKIIYLKCGASTGCCR